MIAATESPPPTTTVAPASARSASIRATAFVPCANDGISKTPSGPFQNTVFTSDSASTIRSWLALPRSTMCQLAGIFSACRVLYSVPAGDLLGHDHVDREHDPHLVLLGRPQDPPRVLDPIRFGEALADRLALGQQERVGHPATEDQQVDLRQQVVDDLDLVADLGAAEDRRERPLRRLEQLARASSSSRSISSPAYAGSSLGTPTVLACARWAVPNASLTYRSA